LTMPQISIVLPLPGSPLIHSSRLCGPSRNFWKSEFLRIQR
jgi:hypothetical protein